MRRPQEHPEAVPRPDGRVEASARRRGPVSLSGRARRRVWALELPLAADRRGGGVGCRAPVWLTAPEPELRSEPELQSEPQVGLQALRVLPSAQASHWVPAQGPDVHEARLRAAALMVWVSAPHAPEVPAAGSVSVRAAAALRPAERAVHAAAAPKAVTAFLARLAAGEAAEVPDESAAAQRDAPVREVPVAAPADAAVRPRAAARRDAQELAAVPVDAEPQPAVRAVWPQAAPWAAASVFRQDRFQPAAGLGPRQSVKTAPVTADLRIASR